MKTFEGILFVFYGSKLLFVKLKIPLEALVCSRCGYLVRKEWNGSTLPVPPHRISEGVC